MSGCRSNNLFQRHGQHNSRWTWTGTRTYSGAGNGYGRGRGNNTDPLCLSRKSLSRLMHTHTHALTGRASGRPAQWAQWAPLCVLYPSTQSRTAMTRSTKQTHPLFSPRGEKQWNTCVVSEWVASVAVYYLFLCSLWWKFMSGTASR